jgi:hypothetical protein
MASADHHDLISEAARRLVLGTDSLWQAICAEWATKCLSREDARQTVTYPIRDALDLGERTPAKVREVMDEPLPSELPPPLVPYLDDAPG